MPGGYTIDRLRDELALRIAAIPEFRAKLADSQLNLDYPVWVEDDAFLRLMKMPAIAMQNKIAPSVRKCASVIMASFPYRPVSRMPS